MPSKLLKSITNNLKTLNRDLSIQSHLSVSNSKSNEQLHKIKPVDVPRDDRPIEADQIRRLAFVTLSNSQSGKIE